MPEFVPENEDTTTIEKDINQAKIDAENEQQDKLREDQEEKLEERRKKARKEEEKKGFIAEVKLSLTRMTANMGDFQKAVWMDKDPYSGNFLQLRRKSSENEILFYVLNSSVHWPGISDWLHETNARTLTYEEALVVNSRLKWIKENKIKPQITGT